MKIGVLSGHTIPGLFKKKENILIETPYDDVTVTHARVGENTVFFINRHGDHASLPPHKINYRANITAFASCHVDWILAIATVGSLKKKIHPGDFVIPHDFIDFTKTRSYTFYDDCRIHVDMTTPYCPLLRTALVRGTKKIVKGSVHDQGVYLATEGPRLETVSEIRLFSDSADIVGMTGVPEVILAREKGLCYASLCLVSNMAAGFQQRLTAEEISKVYKRKEPMLLKSIQQIISLLPEKKTCTCNRDLLKARL
ncbi:MAG: MTAP family purine nucleoside phosphorylase [Methanobacteriota archaeon]